jgi:HAD superfamily hydrolase (TIGR01509 family)
VLPIVAIRPGFGNSPAMLRGLLLDLDDTLYDRSAAFESWADRLAIAQLGRALDANELEALRAHDRRGHRPRAQFAAEAATLGLVVDPAAFPFELVDHIVAEPLARETIAELARTRRIAIVSNGGAAQRLKLARLGLDGVVHAVFVSGELGVAKPDPAIFVRALRWTELAASDVAFVGDQPEVDLVPAAALGMSTVWRARTVWPATVDPAHHRIDRITELAELCA